LINIAASIYNNVGETNDMNLICLPDNDASEKQVLKFQIGYKTDYTINHK
jgi:hypothetical protein